VQDMAEERRVMGRSQLQHALCVSVVGFLGFFFVFFFLIGGE